MINVIIGTLIPFIGTLLGACTVFFMKNNSNIKLQKVLLGFASGVMIAASIWSLIIPSIEISKDICKLYFIPPALGFILGTVFVLILDILSPNISENKKDNKTILLMLAVTLHNIPEGMAVGVSYLRYILSNQSVMLTYAIALSIGIAIQNFPEGAIISMPLRNEGKSKKKSFLYGVISGVVEPIAAFITIALTNLAVRLLPYLLSFAAGAMICVVVKELIPEYQSDKKSNLGTICLSLGFIIMMILDIAL